MIRLKNICPKCGSENIGIGFIDNDPCIWLEWCDECKGWDRESYVTDGEMVLEEIIVNDERKPKYKVCPQEDCPVCGSNAVTMDLNSHCSIPGMRLDSFDESCDACNRWQRYIYFTKESSMTVERIKLDTKI